MKHVADRRLPELGRRRIHGRVVLVELRIRIRREEARVLEARRIGARLESLRGHSRREAVARGRRAAVRRALELNRVARLLNDVTGRQVGREIRLVAAGRGRRDALSQR